MEEIALKRITRDIKDIFRSEKVEPYGFNVELINDSVFDLKCEILGPPNTPYKGGKFELKAKISTEYPFQPPAIRFLTKIWHANICPKIGYICLDTLGDQWAACLTLRAVLMSIQLLLSSSEPDDPLNEEAATQFHDNSEMFNLTASHWTNVYAGGPSKSQSCDDKIRKIIKLGFPENQARLALSSWNWNLKDALKEIDKYK